MWGPSSPPAFGQAGGPDIGIPSTRVCLESVRIVSGMSTFMPSAEQAASGTRWHIIDADGRVLGRIATEAARLLQGKHKPTYTPFIDTGDHVVVVNAAKVKLTGRKDEQKVYRYHSGYEGGMRTDRVKVVRQKNPA